MKKIIIILMVLVILLLPVSCSGAGSSIVGEYFVSIEDEWGLFSDGEEIEILKIDDVYYLTSDKWDGEQFPVIVNNSNSQIQILLYTLM